jgi:hypothetical protein
MHTSGSDEHALTAYPRRVGVVRTPRGEAEACERAELVRQCRGKPRPTERSGGARQGRGHRKNVAREGTRFRSRVSNLYMSTWKCGPIYIRGDGSAGQ